MVVPLISGCAIAETYINADKYVVGNQDYTQQASKIDIVWLNGNVNLVQDLTVSGVKIEESGDQSIVLNKHRVHSYFNDEGELRIKYASSGCQFTTKEMRNLEGKKDLTVIFNPTSLKEFFVDATTSNVESNGIISNYVHIHTTTGDFKADYIVAGQEFTTNIVTGNVEIKGSVSAKKAKLNTTSGNITLNAINVNEFESNITSGDQNLTFINDVDAKIKSTSGDMALTLPTNGGKVSIKHTTGKNIINREHTQSGSTYTFGDGPSTFDVALTTGTITIN